MFKTKTFNLRALFVIVTIVALLIVAVPFAHKSYCQTLAHSYVAQGDVCRFSDVYEYGESWGFGDEWVDVCLRRAAIDGDAWYLYRIHAPIDRRIAGWSSLMYAAKHGNIDGVLVFLRNGADPNFESESGEDAGQIAKRFGHENTARLLDLAKLKSWDSIYDHLELIRELTNEHLWDAETPEHILENSKYQPIREFATSKPTTPYEFIWFQLTDEICVAPYRTHALKLMLDGKRIPGFYYPPTRW